MSHSLPNLEKGPKELNLIVSTYHLQILQILNIYPIICIKNQIQPDVLAKDAGSHLDVFDNTEIIELLM